MIIEQTRIKKSLRIGFLGLVGVLGLSSCATTLPAHPWSLKSQEVLFGTIPAVRVSDSKTTSTELKIILETPRNAVSLHYTNAFDEAHLTFFDTQFPEIETYLQKYLTWRQQIETQKLAVTAKEIGQTTVRLTFYGSHFLGLTASASAAYTYHVPATFSLVQRDGHFVLSCKVGGADSVADPAASYPSQDYYFTDDSAGLLAKLFSPESAQHFTEFLAQANTANTAGKSPGPGLKDQNNPNKDAGKLQ